MSFLSVFRQPMLAILPALLVASACSKKDEPTPVPVPDKGQILFVNAAPGANLRMKFLVDDTEAAQLDYGQKTGYATVNAGNHTVKVSDATATQPPFITDAVAVAKDRNYSYYVYTPNATVQAMGLTLPDDLTLTPGKARIRLVNLGYNAPSPMGLRQVTGSTTQTIEIIPNSVAFATQSSFQDLTPGTFTFFVSEGAANNPVAYVGDGTGTGTSTSQQTMTKQFVAGKCYTVLLRGNGSAISASLQPKAVIIENN